MIHVYFTTMIINSQKTWSSIATRCGVVESLSQKYCACRAHVLTHIPIAGLADIVHEYAAAESRSYEPELAFVCCAKKFTIHMRTGHSDQPYIHISDDFGTNAYMRITACARLCSTFFSVDKCIGIYSPDFDTYYVWRDFPHVKDQFDKSIKMAYKILLAEETGGHLHPDPRLV